MKKWLDVLSQRKFLALLWVALGVLIGVPAVIAVLFFDISALYKTGILLLCPAFWGMCYWTYRVADKETKNYLEQLAAADRLRRTDLENRMVAEWEEKQRKAREFADHHIEESHRAKT